MSIIAIINRRTLKTNTVDTSATTTIVWTTTAYAEAFATLTGGTFFILKTLNAIACFVTRRQTTLLAVVIGFYSANAIHT